MLTSLFTKCGFVFVCVSAADGPDSLLGPQSPGEADFFFILFSVFFEQQVCKDAKSEDRGVLQSLAVVAVSLNPKQTYGVLCNPLIPPLQLLVGLKPARSSHFSTSLLSSRFKAM